MSQETGRFKIKLRKKHKLCFIMLIILPTMLNFYSLKTLMILLVDVTKAFLFGQKLYVVGIMSARDNLEFREAVRNTWNKLVDPKSGDVKFLIGSHSCGIPESDRILAHACNRWSPHLPPNADSKTVFSLTEPTRKKLRVCTGFTFIVKHSMSVEMLGISSSLRRENKDNMYRVELHDSLRGEKVVSATFIISGSDSASGYSWKKVPKVVFNEGFEGELKIISDDDYSKINCSHKFSRNGIINILEVVDTKGFYSKFKLANCPIASFLYKINDIEKLHNFVNETSSRQNLWDEEIEMVKNKLAKEQSAHNDMLIVNMIDVYSNLPLKLNQFIQWSTSEDKYSYIIKTDDDVFLDMKKIQSQFEVASEWDWWSCFKVGWPPPNAGKWRDRLTDLSAYPKFPSGSGYVLKKRSAKKALHKPATNAGEDVSMGLWLVEHSPVDLLESKCFWACGSKCNKNPCNVPELKVEEMYEVWKDYKECGEICRCS